MTIRTRSSFDQTFRKLSLEQQAEVRTAAAELARVFGNPHVHSGLGIRRVGRFFEFRVGLAIWVLFLVSGENAVLVMVGNHDAIQRHVKENS